MNALLVALVVSAVDGGKTLDAGAAGVVDAGVADAALAEIRQMATDVEPSSTRRSRPCASRSSSRRRNVASLRYRQAGLLSRFDGTRTNAEVFALSGKPEHQVRAFLAALLGVEILERRET